MLAASWEKKNAHAYYKVSGQNNSYKNQWQKRGDQFLRIISQILKLYINLELGGEWVLWLPWIINKEEGTKIYERI